MRILKITLGLLRAAAGVLLFLLSVVSVHDRAWASTALFSTAFVFVAYPEFAHPRFALEFPWRKRIAIAIGAFLVAVWFLPDSYVHTWKGIP